MKSRKQCASMECVEATQLFTPTTLRGVEGERGWDVWWLCSCGAAVSPWQRRVLQWRQRTLAVGGTRVGGPWSEILNHRARRAKGKGGGGGGKKREKKNECHRVGNNWEKEASRQCAACCTTGSEQQNGRALDFFNMHTGIAENSGQHFSRLSC